MSVSNKLKSTVAAGVLLLIGAVLGWLTVLSVQKNDAEQMQNRYDLLSKRILIENPNDVLLDFKPLKSEAQKYIETTVGVDNVSFYFEYLPTGSSIGINEDKEVIGASLLKLPVVINVYKLAEEGKIDLDETVALKKEYMNSGYGTLYEKGVGYKLTIREAAKYALQQSDNTAVLLLFDMLSKAEKTNTPQILDFVDANYATSATAQILIGSQSYSSVLKCMYFACYLSKDSSQEILYNLTLSESKERLPLHIPDSVRVAHKIGTYGDSAQSDCGIFFLEKRNYLLCVMVQGDDPQASKYIADLSKIVYDAVSSQKK